VIVYENIQAPVPFIRPFPSFEDVFAEPLDRHRKHFLPLVSVDASVVSDDLDVWLHFVTPIEPLLEGYVGDWTEDCHDFYNSVGQFAFRVCDGKYAFHGDFRYFAYESGTIFKGFPNSEEEIHDDYRLRIASYEAVRQGFQKYERIPWSAASPFDPARGICGPLVTQLGGEPVLGNWEHAGLPVNHAGKPFRYIGEVQGFSYCDGGIQALLLFYDPDEKVALFRSDYT
jgi:hypothetical protein